MYRFIMKGQKEIPLHLRYFGLMCMKECVPWSFVCACVAAVGQAVSTESGLSWTDCKYSIPPSSYPLISHLSPPPDPPAGTSLIWAHLCHVSQGAQPLQPNTYTHTHKHT